MNGVFCKIPGFNSFLLNEYFNPINLHGESSVQGYRNEPLSKHQTHCYAKTTASL